MKLVCLVQSPEIAAIDGEFNSIAVRKFLIKLKETCSVVRDSFLFKLEGKREVRSVYIPPPPPPSPFLSVAAAVTTTIFSVFLSFLVY